LSWIVGSEWDAVWVRKNGSLLPPDRVTFSRWTRTNLFKGFGEIKFGRKLHRYPISGEVTQGKIVVLNYKAEGYPREAIIGTAYLKLSANAQLLKGTWSGFTSNMPDGGTVTMHRRTQGTSVECH